MKNLYNKITVGAGVALASASSFAAGAGSVDLTPLTSSFTAADIITAVLAVAVTLMTVYVAIKAAKIVIGFVRG